MKTATELAQSLLAAARVAPMETSRLAAAIIDGSAPRAIVREYARAIASMAISFPRRIAAVLAVCDDDVVRGSLLANLLEEEGVVSFAPETGLRIEPARLHAAMARKFSRAAGVSEAELAPTPAAPWFAAAIARGDWLGAFSFFAVGFEANVPATFRLLVDPLIGHYSFTRDDLEFLIEHFVADERHGVEAAKLIARVAATEDARDRALAGAKRGGVAWWALHRSAAEPAHP